MNFDLDGPNNLFEYTAGLVPTDANSVFRLRLEKVPGQPGQKNGIFSRRFPDRTCTVKAKTGLLTAGGWSAISGSTRAIHPSSRLLTRQRGRPPISMRPSRRSSTR